MPAHEHVEQCSFVRKQRLEAKVCLERIPSLCFQEVRTLGGQIKFLCWTKTRREVWSKVWVLLSFCFCLGGSLHSRSGFRSSARTHTQKWSHVDKNKLGFLSVTVTPPFSLELVPLRANLAEPIYRRPLCSRLFSLLFFSFHSQPTRNQQMFLSCPFGSSFKI